MKNCGYNDKLNFEKTEQKTETNNKNKRKRNIIWYNPTFCRSVKTNIGREFINLVKKNISTQVIHYQKFLTSIICKSVIHVWRIGKIN